jgi:hypothetical protein
MTVIETADIDTWIEVLWETRIGSTEDEWLALLAWPCVVTRPVSRSAYFAP